MTSSKSTVDISLGHCVALVIISHELPHKILVSCSYSCKKCPYEILVNHSIHCRPPKGFFSTEKSVSRGLFSVRHQSSLSSLIFLSILIVSLSCHPSLYLSTFSQIKSLLSDIFCEWSGAGLCSQTRSVIYTLNACHTCLHDNTISINVFYLSSEWLLAFTTFQNFAIILTSNNYERILVSLSYDKLLRNLSWAK